MNRIEAKVKHVKTAKRRMVHYAVTGSLSLLTIAIGFIICIPYDHYDAEQVTIRFFDLYIWNRFYFEGELVNFLDILAWRLLIAILLVPFIARALKVLICEAIVNRTSLYIEQDKVYGSYGSFSKREMIVPIEQVDNVIVANTLLDRIRTGKTVVLSTSSGKIRFHFIQNADEISAAILEKVNEYKKNYGRNSNIPISEASHTVSEADEIKKYKELLDNGIITQEEFETKKKQLLGG